MKTAFFKPVVRAVQLAGGELVRRNSSHDIYRMPDNKNVVVPRKMDDPRIAYKIVKLAGATL